MAKNIYTVTFTDGTTQEFTNKKALKGLEGILMVQVNGEVTVDNSKEEAVMANTEVITGTEAIEEVVEEVVDMAGTETITSTGVNEEVPTSTDMLLFTASRGKNTRLAWTVLTITEDTEFVKVKGCAIPLPKQAAEFIGKDKFISYIDKDTVQQFVNEGKPIRGMASTLSDIFTRYCKVTETIGADKVTTMLQVFGYVLEAITGKTTEGSWLHVVDEDVEGTEDSTEVV